MCYGNRTSVAAQKLAEVAVDKMKKPPDNLSISCVSTTTTDYKWNPIVRQIYTTTLTYTASVKF